MAEETTVVDLISNPEFVEMLNSMCMGAHSVPLGTLLADLQQKIGQGTSGSIEWIEF